MDFQWISNGFLGMFLNVPGIPWSCTPLSPLLGLACHKLGMGGVGVGSLNIIHLERFREQRSTTKSHYKLGLWPSQETPPFFLQSVT